MNQLVAFNQALEEASRWLERGSSGLVSLSEECEGSFAEVREALSRLTLVRATLPTVREPLLPQIRAAESQHTKEETLYGE